MIISISFQVSKAQTVRPRGSLIGSLETNSQYYFEDINRAFTPPINPFRSNSYLSINYNYKCWTSGVQFEGYLPEAILNMNPQYKGFGFATGYIMLSKKKTEYTIGHFFEQFGSGLIFRAWEDRSLGINNSLFGCRIKWSPLSMLRISLLGGKQRSGFTLSNGVLIGLNTELDLSSLVNSDDTQMRLGFAYFGRYENSDVPLPNFNLLTNCFSGRVSYSKHNFSANLEYVHKAKDPILYDLRNVDYSFVNSGMAVLGSFGYATNGRGVNLTYRRIENMNFLSEREPTIFSPEKSSLYYNDKMLNYIPSINKQHTYTLSNIYVYHSQKLVTLNPSNNTGKAGEIGGMLNVFYEVKRNSKIGGKYGIKIESALSTYFNLGGTYNLYPPAYSTLLFTVGQRYFTDCSLEVTKKINQGLKVNLEYVNQYFNNGLISGTANINVRANILSTRWWFKTSTKSSAKFSMEHLWSNEDRGNWLAGAIEFNFNNRISFALSDMYNYGYSRQNDLLDNLTDPFKIHFYNVGGTYKRGAFRATITCGRQRGGLLCTGGICRYVAPSTGVNLSLIKTF
jgi:hypothetical protein